VVNSCVNGNGVYTARDVIKCEGVKDQSQLTLQRECAGARNTYRAKLQFS